MLLNNVAEATKIVQRGRTNSAHLQLHFLSLLLLQLLALNNLPKVLIEAMVLPLCLLVSLNELVLFVEEQLNVRRASLNLILQGFHPLLFLHARL